MLFERSEFIECFEKIGFRPLSSGRFCTFLCFVSFSDERNERLVMIEITLFVLFKRTSFSDERKEEILLIAFEFSIETTDFLLNALLRGIVSLGQLGSQVFLRRTLHKGSQYIGAQTVQGEHLFDLLGVFLLEDHYKVIGQLRGHRRRSCSSRQGTPL